MNQRKSTILEDRDNWQAEAERLRAINRDLLAALEGMATEFHQNHRAAWDSCGSPACNKARAAIKKAKLPA